jgi:hypothetical protein
VVADGYGGLLVPYGKTIALGQAVLRLRIDIHLRLEQGAKGRVRVKKYFII